MKTWKYEINERYKKPPNMCIKFVLLCGIVVVSTQLDNVSAGCFDSPLTEICSNTTQTVPYLSSRDPSIMISAETSDYVYCDLYALEKHQWYKAESGMTTSCPSMYMCGTKFPIWMKGANPEPHEGIVNRTACRKGFDDCCPDTYGLAAVSCGDYLAYCLLELPSGCHQRYCFDVTQSESTKGVITFSSKKTSAKPVTVSIHTQSTVSKTSGSKVPVSQRVSDTTMMHGISTSFSEFKETSTIPRQMKKSSSGDQAITKEASIEAKDVDGEKKLVVVLTACLALMSAAIIGLVIVIVRRKRNLKVDNEATKSSGNMLESLSVTAFGVKSERPVENMYKTMQYESLKGHDISNPYQYVYQTLPANRMEVPKTPEDLYEDEAHYVELP